MSTPLLAILDTCDVKSVWTSECHVIYPSVSTAGFLPCSSPARVELPSTSSSGMPCENGFIWGGRHIDPSSNMRNSSVLHLNGVSPCYQHTANISRVCHYLSCWACITVTSDTFHYQLLSDCLTRHQWMFYQLQLQCLHHKPPVLRTASIDSRRVLDSDSQTKT